MSLPRELSKILEKDAGPLDEHLSKTVLRSYGVPAVDERIIPDEAQCEKIATEIGFPLVMKGLQKEKVHKTELGLVQLNIQTSKEARETFTSLKKKMDGDGKIIAYKQVKGRIEIIAGLVRDIQFGPCVMLGLGGIMAGILSEAVFLPATLTERDALGLISRLKAQKIFDGFRGEPPIDRKELAGILVALSVIGLRHPRIYEIDVNPLIVSEGGKSVAVDATIILK